MAQIKETTPIAPVLPASTKNTLRQRQQRPAPRQEGDAESRQPQHPDPDHHVDEYA